MTNGYVVGDSGIIMKTTDGGFNWIRQSSGTTLSLNSVFFTDINTGYAVGDSGLIIKTTDGGLNWFRQISGTVNKLKRIRFNSSEYGIIAGASGTILKSTNGGYLWLHQSGDTDFFLWDVAYSNTNVAAIVGTHHEDLNIFPNNSIILWTTNGGFNWIEQLNGTVSGSKPLFCLRLINENVGFVAGWGALLKTTNGATTFLEEKENNSCSRNIFLS